MIRSNRASLAMMFTLVGCGAASAQLITLPGSYGNAAGCAYLQSGQDGDDTAQFLTDRELGGQGLGCSFAIAGTDLGDTILVQGICSHRGKDTLTAESFIISTPYEDGHVEILRANGDIWGELEPCL